MIDRAAGWARLRAVMADYEARPFAWGSADCLCFAADAVHAMTGRDSLGAQRNRYTTRLGAAERLRELGHRHLEDLIVASAKRAGWGPIPPSVAAVGDIGLTLDQTLCVQTPAGFVARRSDGRFVAATPNRAWSLCLK